MLARMTRFSEWFDTLARDRGFETDASVARTLGIQQSVIKRWREGSAPSVDNLRKVSHRLSVPMQQAMIAAGYLTEDEAAVVTIPADPSTLTNDQLMAELARRVAAFDDSGAGIDQNVAGGREVRAMRSPRSADPSLPRWTPPQP